MNWLDLVLGALAGAVASSLVGSGVLAGQLKGVREALPKMEAQVQSCCARIELITLALVELASGAPDGPSRARDLLSKSLPEPKG